MCLNLDQINNHNPRVNFRMTRAWKSANSITSIFKYIFRSFDVDLFVHYQRCIFLSCIKDYFKEVEGGNKTERAKQYLNLRLKTGNLQKTFEVTTH